MASSCHPRRIFLASLGGALLPAQPQPPELDLFFGAFSSEPKDSRASLKELGKSWRNSYAIMLREMLRIHVAYAGPIHPRNPTLPPPTRSRRTSIGGINPRAGLQPDLHVSLDVLAGSWQPPPP